MQEMPRTLPTHRADGPIGSKENYGIVDDVLKGTFVCVVFSSKYAMALCE